MRAAVALRDIVREREDVLIITVVPLESDVDHHIISLPADRDRLGQQRRLRPIEPFDERRDAAFVEQLDAPRLSMARVGEDQTNARIKKRELAKTVLEEI